MDIAVATRPVRPDDRPLFQRLWPRLSPDTVYRRFHSPLHGLPPEAVVALVGGEVVGVARYDRSPDDPATAEFAILVEDGWQGVGLGRQLLVELIGLATDRGVRTLTATVQRDNERVIGLIRRLLPGSSFVPDFDVFLVVSPLTGAPVPTHP